MSTTIKKQLQRQVETVMQYKKFLLDYLYEDWWLASIMPQEIAEELPVSHRLIDSCFCRRVPLVERELLTLPFRST